MKEKRDKKKWVLMLFIVVIMIGTSFSAFIFSGAPASEVEKFNGIKFTGSNNIWTARINGKDAAFSYLPKETENIPVADDFPGLLQGKAEIDLTSDFSSNFSGTIALAQHQMGLTLSAYGIYSRKGFTSNTSFNFPVITCKESTKIVPVVYFRQSNTTQLYVENGCIIAEASSNSDFIRVKDRLLYGLLGVLT
ncbi:hypothetical protein HYS31_02240 [Candidatus Woesearchaeota archaeon]|nr:hypothetical protein [Candidatus Woesearchaeota archaeon]